MLRPMPLNMGMPDRPAETVLSKVATRKAPANARATNCRGTVVRGTRPPNQVPLGP